MAASVWSASWPVLAGAVVTLAIWCFLPRLERPWYPRIPAGDVLVVAVWLGEVTSSAWQAVCRVTDAIRRQAMEFCSDRDQGTRQGLLGVWPESLEAALRRIGVGGTLFLIVLLTLFILLASAAEDL